MGAAIGLELHLDLSVGCETSAGAGFGVLARWVSGFFFWQCKKEHNQRGGPACVSSLPLAFAWFLLPRNPLEPFTLMKPAMEHFVPPFAKTYFFDAFIACENVLQHCHCGQLQGVVGIIVWYLSLGGTLLHAMKKCR